MLTIEDRLRELIVEQLGVDESGISDDARFVGDLCADSLDSVELLVAAEDEFEIDISDDEWEACDTVADAIALVKRLKGVA